MQPFFRKRLFLFIEAAICLFFLGGCGHSTVRHPITPVKSPEQKIISRLGSTIQAGAFANVENAARLARSLQEKGLDATYFAAAKGLFKVRFGNFPTRELARVKAEEVKQAGFIEEFYIVGPEEYPVANRTELGEVYLREELVRSARSFLGVPYLWGGTSVEKGFDCSGLTMTVYQLNGFDLPRTSAEQFDAGSPVSRPYMEKGDLLFFSKGNDKVSHVGIYAGDNHFIHAPGRGRQIRTDNLSKGDWNRMFIGARSYL
jgi:hypothetical protein